MGLSIHFMDLPRDNITSNKTQQYQ